MSILKRFACDLDKFTLIYALLPSEAFGSNTKSGMTTNTMLVSAFDIYKREVFDIFKVLDRNTLLVPRLFMLPFCSFLFLVLFQLLGELLLDRYNFSVMTKFISNTDNLKQQMNLLKEKSKNIQFEAFHVFKVFCSFARSLFFSLSLNKDLTDRSAFSSSRSSLPILRSRKPFPIFFFAIEKSSSSFSRHFTPIVSRRHRSNEDHSAPLLLGTDDEQFNDEKAYLIKQISELKDTKG